MSDKIMTKTNMPDPKESDVIIIGAGPAGLATALGLSGSGLSVTIIDKTLFPRDKVCGGGLSSRSLRVLGELLPASKIGFPMLPIHGFSLVTPDQVEYIYLPAVLGEQPVLGATIDRRLFDHALLEAVVELPGTVFIGETEALAIHTSEGRVDIETSRGCFKGRMAIVADGAHSKLINSLAGDPFDRKTDAIALRGIFKDVKPEGAEAVVSFYFLKDVFPGYFWLFPLPDGHWNAGIYLPLGFKQQKKHNLNRLFFDIIQESSVLSGRFQDAILTGSIGSDILPLGKCCRHYSGERWLSVGDAASLVDPLAGEGIGNALMSGQLAAGHLLEAFRNNNFSTSFNSRYEKELLRRIGPEIKFRQRLIRFFGTKPRLFNWVFRQIARSSVFQRTVVRLLYGNSAPGRLEFYQ